MPSFFSHRFPTTAAAAGAGAGSASAEAMTNNPPWFSHPGQLRAGAVPNEAGEYNEEDYVIPPGILPRYLQRAYHHYTRPFARYENPLGRIAPLTELQRRAHQRAATLRPELDRTFESVLTRLDAGMGQNARSATQPYLSAATQPFSEASRTPWAESINRGVIRPLQDEMKRNLMENVLPSIDAQLIGTGNFMGGQRGHRYRMAIRDMNEALARESSRALLEGERLSEEGMQKHLGRQMHAAEVASGTEAADLDRTIMAARTATSMIGDDQRRRLMENAAMEAAGRAEQEEEQRELTTQYEDFLREQAFPGENLAALGAAVRGHAIPTATSGTYSAPQPPAPSPLTQLAGAAMNLYGMHLMGGGSRGGSYKGGSIRSSHRHGGRTKHAYGGSALDMIMNRVDPMNMIHEKMWNGSQGNPDVMQDTSPDMTQPEMQEEPNYSPTERGAMSATEMTNQARMHRYRQKMDEYASKLEAGGINPWGAFLARTGAKMMSSQAPNFGARMGEAMGAGLDDYTEALKQNQAEKQRAFNIQKAVYDTYRIEELDREKREAEARKAAHDERALKAEEALKGAHTKYYEAMAKAAGQSKDKTVSIPVQVPTADGESKTEDIKVEPLTKTREQRLKELKDAWTANEEALNVSESMLNDIGKLGYTGTGASLLSPSVATAGGLYGNTAKHANFFKKSESLATLKAAALRGVRPNVFLEKQIRRTKPEEGDTSETMQQNMLEHVDLFRRNNIEIIAERKMIKSGVPDDVMDDAFIAWRKENKPDEKGNPKELKGTPLDYLPTAWKVAIGSSALEAADTRKTEASNNENASSISSEKQSKLAAIDTKIAQLEAKIAAKSK